MLRNLSTRMALQITLVIFLVVSVSGVLTFIRVSDTVEANTELRFAETVRRGTAQAQLARASTDLGAVEIRDGASDAQRPMVRAGTQTQPLGGAVEQGACVGRECTVRQKPCPGGIRVHAPGVMAAITEGLPRARTALHVCRGNWTPDESVALSGDYRPLLALFNALDVGTLFLELCTPRAGDVDVLKGLADRFRVGVGVVNQKTRDIERPDEILAKARAAIRVLGPERVLLTPDCGFATFADNPVASAAAAQGKLAAIVAAASTLRLEHGLSE